MLMTRIKSADALLPHLQGKVFVVTCHGCREVSLHGADQEAERLVREIAQSHEIVGQLTTDYICNPEYFHARFDKYADRIAEADTILVFSCGVGVQTIADFFPGKRVCPGNDTYSLPGHQGVTPLEHDCKQCGECFLNLTGGICPLTACSKGLVNGQCGGAKDGKCEVDPNMECGWERIYQKLKKIGRLDALKCPVQVRNYATDDEVSK